MTGILTQYKFGITTSYIDDNNWSSAFFSFLFFCLFYELIAGVLCWIEPAAAGSGIPEIRSFLNGINLNKAVRIRVLICKVIGMCFAQAGGLPLGKEGPMIHAGAIVGAAVSQGKTITFGLDTSWTKFQDLRNDRSKRDFVTFGAAAGVAAAFNAPSNCISTCHCSRCSNYLYFIVLWLVCLLSRYVTRSRRYFVYFGRRGFILVDHTDISSLFLRYDNATDY